MWTIETEENMGMGKVLVLNIENYIKSFLNQIRVVLKILKETNVWINTWIPGGRSKSAILVHDGRK